MTPSPTRPDPSPLEARIEHKRVKLEQLKARQMRLEDRMRFAAARQARRKDTRRKILIRATILAKIERGGLTRRNSGGCSYRKPLCGDYTTITVPDPCSGHLGLYALTPALSAARLRSPSSVASGRDRRRASSR